MRVLRLRGLDAEGTHEKALAKVFSQLAAGDLRSSDVKKLGGFSRFYRARLDYANRLLLQFARFEGELCALALEVIEGHAYERSRFLRGAPVGHDFEAVTSAFARKEIDAESGVLRFVPKNAEEFRYLGSPLFFDDDQQAALGANHVQDAPSSAMPAWVLVGGAGSGKTAVVLAWMAERAGRTLYVTQSRALVSRVSTLFAEACATEHGTADFVPFADMIAELAPGPQITFPRFEGFAARYAPLLAPLNVRARDGGIHSLYEEFRGVLGAARPGQPLSLREYQALGVRESIFLDEDRAAVFAAFEAYRQWLTAEGYVDPNLVVPAPGRTPRDTLVVDEVQDFTPAELATLRLYAGARRIALAGDANQMVHPNFFSWTRLRSSFGEAHAGVAPAGIALHLLPNNYRNARLVTEFAERVLRVKHARFGSADRESDLLPKAAGDVEAGVVRGLVATDDVLALLDDASAESANTCVIVLRDEDKKAAQIHFRTPLVFAVHEAKGLEFDTVILFQFAASAYGRFAELTLDVSVEKEGELPYRRRRDKEDRTPERLRFYANALYVAATRALRRALVVEPSPAATHPLYALLGVTFDADPRGVESKVSSLADWAALAEQLEEAGNDAQAKAVREKITIGQEKSTQRAYVDPPWSSMDSASIADLVQRAGDLDGATGGAPNFHGATAIGGAPTFQGATATGGAPTFQGATATSGAPNFHGDSGKRLKAQRRLAEVALFHDDAATLHWLSGRGYRHPLPARRAGETEDGVGRAVRMQREALTPFAYQLESTKVVLADVEKYGLEHRTPMHLTPLMQSVAAGNFAVTRALLDAGADLSARDPYGRTALGWALASAHVVGFEKSTTNVEYAQNFLGPFAEALAAESLAFRYRDVAFSLLRHEPIYWVYQVFEAFFRAATFRSPLAISPVSSHELAQWMSLLPMALAEQARTRTAVEALLQAHGPTSERPLFSSFVDATRPGFPPSISPLPDLVCRTGGPETAICVPNGKSDFAPVASVLRLPETYAMRPQLAGARPFPSPSSSAFQGHPFAMLDARIEHFAEMPPANLQGIAAFATFHDDLLLASRSMSRGAHPPIPLVPDEPFSKLTRRTRELLPLSPVDSTGRDELGMTPLMRAVVAKNIPLVEQLAPKADLLARDPYGRTAFSWLLSLALEFGSTGQLVNRPLARSDEFGILATLVRPKALEFWHSGERFEVSENEVAFYIQAVTESCFRPGSYRAFGGRSGALQPKFVEVILGLPCPPFFANEGAPTKDKIAHAMRANPRLWTEPHPGDFLPNAALGVPWNKGSSTLPNLRALGLHRVESLFVPTAVNRLVE